jgi:hypothetical protein
MCARSAMVEEDARNLRIESATPRWSGEVNCGSPALQRHNALAAIALGEALELDPAGFGAGLRRSEACPAGWSAWTAASRSASSSTTPIRRRRCRRFSTAGADGRGRRRRADRRLRFGRRAGRPEAADDGPHRRGALPPGRRHRRGSRGEDRDAILDEIAAGAEAAGQACGEDLLLHRGPSRPRSRPPSSGPGPVTSSCSPARVTSRSIIMSDGPSLGRAVRSRAGSRSLGYRGYRSESALRQRRQ